MIIDPSYTPHFDVGPSFATVGTNRHPTAALANGKRYEKQALTEIGRQAGSLNWNVKASPWIRYKSLEDECFHYCQPDILVWKTQLELLLIEIKLKHTRKAFPQINFYKDVLSLMFPKTTISCQIFCRWFDPVEGVVPLYNEIAYNPSEITAVVWKP